jgi:YD repeat-containing protein
MERSHSFWIAVAALLLVSSFVSPTAHAVLPDVCISAGGTAECTGPEVGEYRYYGGRTTWPGTPSYQYLPSEQQVLQTLLNYGEQVYFTCTQDLQTPQWLSLPAGPLGLGSRTVGDPAAVQQTTGDYWNQHWNLGVEDYQAKHTVRIFGTRASNVTPPCTMQIYSGALGSIRQRGVHCPAGWSTNDYTAPTWSYCWRAPQTKPDLPKALGPCKDCALSKGNPINIATGNKYQEELDYRGSGPFPLEYVRRHNSQAYDQIYYGPNFHTRLPTWRGTYDRAVLFNEHPTYPTARVYRHDGSVLQFRLSTGTWVPDGDVVERLTRLVNGSGETTGWTLTTKDDELETYDATGHLQSIQNRAGITQTLTYDATGRIASVTHSFGEQLTFAYDSNDHLATITVPGGGIITYTYAASNGNLASVTYPDTRVRT